MIGKGPVPPSVAIDTSAMDRRMQDQAAAQASGDAAAGQQQQQQS